MSAFVTQLSARIQSLKTIQSLETSILHPSYFLSKATHSFFVILKI